MESFYAMPGLGTPPTTDPAVDIWQAAYDGIPLAQAEVPGLGVE